LIFRFCLIHIEEELNLPPLFADGGDGAACQTKIICQDY